MIEHLRHFYAFAPSARLGEAARRLGLQGKETGNFLDDKRHSQVAYHLQKLAEILKLQASPFDGLFRTQVGSNRKELTDAGSALMGWIETNPDLLRELALD